jgi:hypothetical protein
MKKIKKILVAITATLGVAMIGPNSTVSATNYYNPTNQYGYPYNPNIVDTQWAADANPNDYCRPKFTDSSVYVYNYSMTHSAIVTIKGRKTQTGADIGVSYNGHETEGITLPPNNEREIYQGIIENQCTYAHITFDDADTYYGAAYGVWSPDVVGSFTPLN